MKLIVVLALSGFASMASAHSDYWRCTVASGSIQAAQQLCGSREHYDRTGRVGGGFGGGYGGGGYGRHDDFGHGGGGWNRGGFGHRR